MNPKISTLIDDFTNPSATSANFTGNYALINGEMVLTAGTHAATINYYDLSNSSLMFELISYSYDPDAYQPFTFFTLRDDTWGIDVRIEADYDGLEVLIFDGDGSSGAVTIPASANLVRIRHSGTYLYWEGSSDASTWSLIMGQELESWQIDELGAVKYDFRVPGGASWEDPNAIIKLGGINALPPASPPTISTSSVINIAKTSATGRGNVTNDGGATITERGVVYSTSTNPTTSNSKATASGTTGSFSTTISGLSAGTTYYVRAYAINSAGTSYGSQVSFTTLPPSVTVSNTRNATVRGHENASNTRSATIKGGVSVSAQRTASLDGYDTHNDTIAARLTGFDLIQAQRDAVIVGSDSGSSEVSATVRGADYIVIANDQHGFVAGGDGRHVEHFDDTSNRDPSTTAKWSTSGRLEMS